MSGLSQVASPQAQPSDDSSSEQLQQQSLRWSKLLCLITLIFPLLTAVGWIFDIPLLTHGHPTLPAMQPNTAVGLIFGALAILLTRKGPTTSWRRLSAFLMASAILMLGALTLAEYAFGWDVGLDRIFAHGPPTAEQPFPGRPSPQTSLNFVLLGAAILSFNLGAGMFYVGQLGALAAAGNAVAAATGYIFSSASFYAFPIHLSGVGMAVHTAISFILLVIALFCARPDEGMMTLLTSDTRSGGMARRIFGAGIVAPPFVGALTRVGVAAGWYGITEQVSLFALVMIGLILQATWRAARRSEHEERVARDAFQALQHTHEKLRRTSEERQIFGALVENSPDFIGIADANGKPVYLNPAGRRMVGLAPDFPVGSVEIVDCYAHDQRAFATDVILKSMVESGYWQGETAFRHWQTEQAIPVSDTHFMIRNPDTGQILGMGTITRDITERKRLEEELSLAEAKASGLVAVAADAIISIDPAQRITLFNEGAEKVFGYSKTEAIGASIDMLIPQRLRAIHRQHVEQFAAGQSTARRIGERGMDIVGLRKNGEEFPADATISKLDVGGTRILTVALRDITEQKRVEREQQFIAEVASELTATLGYEETLESVARLGVRRLADVCVIDIVDDAGDVQRTKVVCADPFKDWLGARLMQVRLDPDRPDPIWTVLRTGKTFLAARVTTDTLASLAQSDEHLRVLRGLDLKSVLAVPLVARGKLIGSIILLLCSTTTRVYGQGDVRMAEALAGQAALSIENARLYREAQRAIKMREEVLAIVSHDLRNPLNTIAMVGQLLMRLASSDQDKVREAAARLNRSAGMMQTLIGDLLDFAKIQGGALAIDRHPERLDELAAQVVDVLKPQASAKGLRLDVNIPRDLPNVFCDKFRVVQVLSNLLGNAIKFTAAGGVQLSARAVGRNLEVSVTDTGPGIGPEDVPTIFERFWQAKETRTLGAGLGLSIARGIVAAHGGRIWVESTPGVGSTFRFTLPVAYPQTKARHA